MSSFAVLTTTAEHLRSLISTWNNDNCQPTPDERPIPIQGSFFCSVHMVDITPRISDGLLLSEVYTFGITVSRRIEAVPFDEVANSIYLSQTAGLSIEIEKIKYAIHKSHALRSKINQVLCDIGDDSDVSSLINSTGFFTAPELISGDFKPEWRDEEWFHGTHSSPPRNMIDGHVGLSITVLFGNFVKETALSGQSCS